MPGLCFAVVVLFLDCKRRLRVEMERESQFRLEQQNRWSEKR